MIRSLTAKMTCTVLLWILPVFVSPECARGMDTPNNSIAARVNGTPIYVDRVKHLVNQLLGTRKATTEGRKMLEDMALEQLIDRQLVLGYLKQRGELASDREVDIELDRVKDRLARREKTMADYLRDRKETADALRQEFLWTLTWQRYVEKHITEESIRKYFDQHRREFDGSRIHVAHILVKTADDPDSRRQAVSRLQYLRQRILDGEFTFAEAARTVSNAPTGKEGGDLGWIERHRPMPESFSRAAFALETDQISLPTTTPMGVHLIKCLEISPGQKSWHDVHTPLVKAMTRHLFTRACRQQRPTAKIERLMTNRLPAEPHKEKQPHDGSGP